MSSSNSRDLPSPLPVGVIGVGNMGQHHARILSLMKDVEVVGIADVNAERGREIANQYETEYYEDYRNLLANVSAISIAVPTVLHYEVGMNCLNSGVHVLMEKPLAASIEEAEALATRASELDLTLQVGHIERFNPSFQELSKVLQKEELLAVEAHRMSPYSSRANDVSVVFDLMIHDIDLLLEMVPYPVVEVNACGNKTAHSGSKFLDFVTATLRFSNNVIATLTASKVTHRKMRCIAAHCKESLTEADFLNNEILIHRQKTTNCVTEYGQVLYRQDGVIEKVYTHNVEPLKAELEHFIECVRGGDNPSVGGEQALKALRLASQIEESALASVPLNGATSDNSVAETLKVLT